MIYKLVIQKLLGNGQIEIVSWNQLLPTNFRQEKYGGNVMFVEWTGEHPYEVEQLEEQVVQVVQIKKKNIFFN